MLYYCLGSESPTAYGVAATDAQHMQTLRTPTSAPPPTTAMMPAGLITPPIYYAQPRLHLPDNIALAAAAAGGPPTYIQHHPHHHHHVEVHSPPFAPHSTPQSPATPSFAAPHNTNNNNNNGAAALFISPMLPPTAGQSPVVFGQVMAPTTLDGGFRLILPDGVVRATTAAATTAERMPPTVCLSGPLSFTTNAPPAMFQQQQQQQQQHVLATPVTPCSLSSFPDLTPPAVRPGYALGARYQGRVKRFNPNRGYGFLCASHQLLHISHEEAVVQQREDEDGKKDVVRLDGRFYKRVPVSLDDIFVHHCHLQSTTNNNNNNTNNAINPPTPPASAMPMMSDAVGEKYSGPVLPVGSCVWFTVGTFEGRVQNKYQAIDVRVLPPCGALLIDDDVEDEDDALVEGSENNLAGSEASISSIATPGLSLGSGKKRSMAEEEALLITPHNRAQQHSDVNVNLHSPWGAGLRSPSKSFWDDVLRSPPDAHQASGAEAPTNTHTTSGDFLAVGTITSTQEVSTLHNNASNNIAGVKRTTTIATSSQNSSPLQRPRNMDEQRRLLSMKGFVSDAIVHVRIP